MICSTLWRGYPPQIQQENECKSTPERLCKSSECSRKAEGLPGFTNQHVTQFRVEFRLGDVSGSNTLLPGTFFMTGAKKEHIFPTPIHARYVRIVVLAWNDGIAMRAALIVKQCTSCIANAISTRSSMSAAACQCQEGTLRSIRSGSNLATTSAIALVPARAQFSTLHNRVSRWHVATASFQSTAGPTGKGALSFDRNFIQYMDGGSHTFNIAMNGGFTVVAVVRFTGANAAGPAERIIDFGSGPDSNNILIARHNTDQLVWSLRNSATQCFIITSAVIVQNSWITIVATYVASNRFMQIRAGSVTASGTCEFAVNNRIVTNTFVGKSAWDNVYLLGTIAGLYAVDAVMSELEIAEIAASMYNGDDPLLVCQTCAANGVAVQGTTSAKSCVCATNSFEETRVLNPPTAQRTYSSALVGDGLTNSLLNDLHGGTAWYSSALNSGQWMQIDAGQSMQIVGIITQGRGNVASQFVTQFRVEYKLEDSQSYSIAMPGTFSMVHNARNEHIFAVPINARFVQIIVLAWNGYICMRAGLIERPCSSCTAGAISTQSSTSEAACQCPSGAYKSSDAINRRAIAMTPGRAQLSRLTNRDQPLVYTITGTVFGGFVGVDFPNRVAWKLRGDVYVFWIHQGHVKMTAVTLAAAQNSATPVSTGDRYVTSTSAPTPVTVQMLQDMWDGTFPDFSTTSHNQDTGYDVKNVQVSCAGLCGNTVFDSTAGPSGGRGAVTFNCALSQYINGGLHTFAIATEGGFTAIAVVMFTAITTGSNFERIIDFRGTNNHDNIIISRTSNVELVFIIRNSDANSCSLWSDPSLVENTWHTLVATYIHRTKTITFNIGGVTTSKICDSPRLNRNIDNTFVGRSNFASDPFFQGRIAGLYAVDALLSAPEIMEISMKMFRGEDVLLAMAIELVPGRAQFSTLENRNLLVFASTAVFDNTAGPPGSNGAVTFDRGLSQYIDGGLHSFSIATNGGFTAVAVVRFTGSPLNSERIFDFGNGESNNNILIGRTTSTSLRFIIFNGADVCDVISANAVIADVWTTIVVKYTSSNRAMEIRVGGTSAHGTCAVPRTNKILANTFVGKSNWGSDPYLSGSIAGLHAIDTVLSETQIASVIDRIYKGSDDSLQCEACSASAVSASGSTAEASCECLTGSYKSVVSQGVSGRALVLNTGPAHHLTAVSVPDTSLVRARTGVDGWRLVRFLPPTSTAWYSGNDNLAGILPRGTAYDNRMEWSIPFGEFDEFCFSTLNFLHWLHCSKEEAIVTFYGVNSDRVVIRSSISPTQSYTAKWQYRPGTATPEDPWVGLRNHGQAPVNTDTGDRILYGESSWTNHWSLPTISSDGGMCVWVRRNFVGIPVPAPSGGGALVLVTDRAELVITSARDTSLVRAKTKRDGWRLVRFLPPSSTTWYSSNDDLAGIFSRGTAHDYNTEWSIPFGEFDEFCFSTCNFLHWLHCTKDAAIGAIYSNGARSIIQSSVSIVPYTASWFNRGNAAPEDPWIGLRNHGVGNTNTNRGDRILYGENSFSGAHFGKTLFRVHIFFKNARRSAERIWGEDTASPQPMVINWPGLTDMEKTELVLTLSTTDNWILLTHPLGAKNKSQPPLKESQRIARAEGKCSRHKGWWREGKDELATHSGPRKSG